MKKQSISRVSLALGVFMLVGCIGSGGGGGGGGNGGGSNGTGGGGSLPDQGPFHHQVGNTLRFESMGCCFGAVAVGDFDGDGHLDIAATRKILEQFEYGVVSVFFGDGSGNFTTSSDHITGIWDPISITSGDLSGNGRDDLAVGGPVVPQVVSILISNSDRSFQKPVDYLFESSRTLDRRRTGNTALLDITGNGTVDFLEVSFLGVSTRLGSGDGRLQELNDPAISHPRVADVVDGKIDIGVGDFSGNGTPELALLVPAVNPDMPAEIVIARSNGDGTFNVRQIYSGAPVDGFGIVVDDFNGSGLSDLAIVSREESEVVVYINNGVVLLPRQILAVGNSPVDIISADFSGDGSSDIATLNPGDESFSILINDGEGGFSEAENFPAGQDPVSFAAGDIDMNGQADIVILKNFGLSVEEVRSADPSRDFDPAAAEGNITVMLNPIGAAVFREN